jgi:hypothetical protein
MVPSQLSINRHVLVQVRQQLLSTRSVAPIAHEIAHNSEEGVHLDTGAGHLVVGSVADKLGGGAGGLDVGEDGVAGGAEREGQEGGADVGGDAGEDDLLLAGCFDGLAEVGVVPGAGGCQYLR